MAYQSTEIDLENVLLSDTTKATFKKLNDNATILENNAQAVDAQISELYGDVGDINTALGNKQPLDADLTAIAGLTGTSGLLKKTAADTWTLDTTAYTTNTGTVTSVSAGTGLSISGTATVNPTVNIASGYKLLTTSEYNTLDAGATAGSTAVQPGDLGTAAAKDFTTSVTSGSADLVTSGAVYTAIQDLPEPMIFKGTLGTGGTITTLPTAASGNEGYVYKVITAGTYASQSAKVGDTFICAKTGTSTYEWVLIPSGDDVEDTWRNIKVNGTELLGNAITTGAVNFKDGGNITVTGSGSDITLGVASGYSIPSTTDQTAWSGAVTSLADKMDKANPTGTGYLAINPLEQNGSPVVGQYAVALGGYCSAAGKYAMGVGHSTGAGGEAAFAEGYDTLAWGNYSHAMGHGSQAKGRSQLVFGEYNTGTQATTQADRADYVEIVGNGTSSSARSNARTLDWSGNEVLAGTSTAIGFKTPSGTSSGFLKADGSVDTTAYTTNTGTVTSVSAGTGLSISGTASTTPTVNIASGYKLPTTSEYNALATQTYVDNAVSALAVTVEKTFTASDAGWSSTADSDGNYTLTLTSSDVAGKHPFACYKDVTINNATVKCEVMATLGYTSTSIVIIADQKFAGSVLLI